MTMHKIFRTATTTITGLALVGASQFALIQTAHAGPRGGVHYGGGHHGGRGGPGGPGARHGLHHGGHHGIHHAHFRGFHVGWRPHGLFWHPVGFLLTTMAVTAPVGANIPSLPDDTQDVVVGSNTYYYYQGTFYTQDDKGFTVVTAPAGATVSYVPQGYTTQTINGTIYYEYGGVDYQPKMVDGGTAYVVVRV